MIHVPHSGLCILAYASCASYTRVLLKLSWSELEYNWILLDFKTIHNIFTQISTSRLIFFCFFLLELRFIYNNGRFRQLDLLYPLIKLALPVCISRYVGRLLTWEEPVLWWMIIEVLYAKSQGECYGTLPALWQ